MSTKYSLVTTVLNDRAGTEAFFEAMSRQTRRPDEIIVVDGGSKDGTWELLQAEVGKERARGLRVLREKGCNVARGRDLAIGASCGELIVSTDVGCEWEAEWFAELVAPFESQEGVKIDVVVGSWEVKLADAKSDWARVEFARRYPFRLEATPESLGINRAIAYRRQVWEKVGGYPQDLTLAADDVVFDMILRQPKWGFRFAAAPVPRCSWERHETLKQFAKEERRNFFGAAEAGIWCKHFVLVSGRMALEAVSLVGFLLLAASGLFLWAGLCVLPGLLSFGWRLRSLAPAAGRLRQWGVPGRWWRLLVFEYVTKFRGMQGYWSGIWNGRKSCQRTRERLRG